MMQAFCWRVVSFANNPKTLSVQAFHSALIAAEKQKAAMP
jgi:hypothetical protein